MEKMNTIISLIDWKIIMFEDEGGEICESDLKSFNLLFTYQKKNCSPKKWG